MEQFNNPNIDRLINSPSNYQGFYNQPMSPYLQNMTQQRYPTPPQLLGMPPN